MPASEVTIAELLKPQEYATACSPPANPVSEQPPPQIQILAVTERNHPRVSQECFTNAGS